MQIKIATYNVQRLYMEEDVTPSLQFEAKSKRSLASLAESIDRMDADLVSLQDLSSKGTLEKDLLSLRGLAEKYPHVAYVKSNNSHGFNLGILSKYPFTEVVTHIDTPVPLVDGSGEMRFSRDLMRVDVNLDQDPEAELSIYNASARLNQKFCKQRSKLPRLTKEQETDLEMRRLSEAQAIRNIVDSEMKDFPDRLFVVTGDLQDTTDSPSVQAMLNPKGREKWLDSLDHLPEKERKTWPARPTKSKKYIPGQIDHILYPERFAAQMKGSSPIRYEQSLDSDTRWVSSNASDHLPVVSTFEVDL